MTCCVSNEETHRLNLIEQGASLLLYHNARTASVGENDLRNKNEIQREAVGINDTAIIKRTLM
jgi:hypothetical protein